MRKVLLVICLVAATLMIRQMPYLFYSGNQIVGEIQTEQFVICQDCLKLDKLRPKLRNPLLDMGVRIPNIIKGGKKK